MDQGHSRICVIHSELPNGERYPLVGGTRLRRFDGTHSKPRKGLENAQTPTSRVHAVLGAGFLRSLGCPAFASLFDEMIQDGPCNDCKNDPLNHTFRKKDKSVAQNGKVSISSNTRTKRADYNCNYAN